MDDWHKILAKPNDSIYDIVEIIDKSGMQIALIVDENNKLLGTVTDGDMRRALLKKIDFSRPSADIMNKSPHFVYDNEYNTSNILSELKKLGLRHMPIVNRNMCLVDLVTHGYDVDARDNYAVIMVGGLGKRLRPLTENCPKPLLEINSKPVLEIVLENFIRHGFNKFYFVINYKGFMIKNHFGDGSKWGVNIDYFEENKPLGTAGALGLMKDFTDKPFVVMNGDLLTNINFDDLLNFHREHDACATMCVREYDFQVPFGVVDVNEHKLLGVEEKPVHSFFVNAGIYVLNPEVMENIPVNTKYDMPQLFDDILRKQANVASFPLREYWLDIGRVEDFEKAHKFFCEKENVSE
jgi:dTDP-glucose pyrophosphorylase